MWKVSLLFLTISYRVKMPQNIKAAAVCFIGSGDTCHTMSNLPYSDIRLMVLIQNCDTEWNTRLHIFFTVFFYISTSRYLLSMALAFFHLYSQFEVLINSIYSFSTRIFYRVLWTHKNHNHILYSILNESKIWKPGGLFHVARSHMSHGQWITPWQHIKMRNQWRHWFRNPPCFCGHQIVESPISRYIV